MPSATTKLGLLSTVSAIVWLVLPGTANADTQTNVTFDAVVSGEELDGRLSLPEPMPEDPPAIDSNPVDSYTTRTPVTVLDSLAFMLDEI